MNDDQAAAKRAVLREHGIDVPDRGKLSAEHLAAYDRIREGRPPQPSHGGYDSGVTDADFDQAGMEEATPRATTGQRGHKSRRPSQQASATARGLWGKVKGKPKRGAKKHPWVSTSDVIEHFWSQLAWSARPLPPLQKILAAQAPMAGAVLEEATRDTFIDRMVLQPAARVENRLQAVNAMVGPPVFTLAIALQGRAMQAPDGSPMTDEDGNYVYDSRTQMMIGGLRFSLMSWLKIGGKRAEEIKADAQALTDLGDQADDLIRWILAPPGQGQSPKDIEREAQRRGAEFATAAAARPGDGAPVTQDQVTDQLEQMARSSAFSPTPATGSKS